MTSTISNVRRGRRAPLPHIHSIRDEREDSRRSDDAAYEASLIGDLFPMRQTVSEVTDGPNTPRSKVMHRRSSKGVSPPTDFELMSSMMQKLNQLEKKVALQALDINKKKQTSRKFFCSLFICLFVNRVKIAVLEEKLNLLHERTEREREKQEVDRKCCRLQKQVFEMEKFLNDYGMIWVGDNQNEADDEDEDEAKIQPTLNQPEAFSLNYDLVLQNIRNLNLLAAEGGTRITLVPGGAKLMQRPAVDLQLYTNGMVMSNEPFRSYTEPQTQKFLQDLMDGFFPSELQDRFPHGVIFQVVDRRMEMFRVDFPGKGHIIGGSKEEVMRYRSEVKKTGLSFNPNCYPDSNLTIQQFLNKLPECVMKRGNVINIRSSLKHHLQGGDGAENFVLDVIETPALQTSRGCGKPPYDIISAFPHQCCHSDDTQSLLQCGLTPSAALLLRPRAKVTS
ncbi:hypothetical protein HF521_011066 [Silurus meridionalis]|uniref:UBX domain-containing protein 11 n=1 Tax=Silurus meridionalis TaxID=175797 RepID=A0A8T0AHW9_SILME|nr:hypothetical protein HF521_011066 [Silurus meridionalis]